MSFRFPDFSKSPSYSFNAVKPLNVNVSQHVPVNTCNTGLQQHCFNTGWSHAQDRTPDFGAQGMNASTCLKKPDLHQCYTAGYKYGSK